jgi:hypothetical protein
LLAAQRGLPQLRSGGLQSAIRDGG